MTLQQLNIFLVVCEEKNFTRAAERLFISQPTVSREILALEEELQCTLFARNRRVMTLTEAGKRILPEVRKIVEGVSGLPSLARGKEFSVKGSVRIGYIVCGQLDLLMEQIKDTLGEHPGLTIETAYDTPAGSWENYRRRRTDIQLGARAMIPNRHGPLFVLNRSSLAVMVLKNDSLFKRRSLSVEDLRDKPVIMPDPEQAAGLYRAYIDICESAGFSPKVVGNGKMLADKKIQMQLHDAIAFVSKECAYMSDESLRVIPVEGDFPEVDCVAVTQRKSSCECLDILSRILQKTCAANNRAELGDGM